MLADNKKIEKRKKITLGWNYNMESDKGLFLELISNDLYRGGFTHIDVIKPSFVSGKGRILDVKSGKEYDCDIQFARHPKFWIAPCDKEVHFTFKNDKGVPVVIRALDYDISSKFRNFVQNIIMKTMS